MSVRISLVAAALAASITAPVQAQTFQQILEGAKKEGALVVAVSSPGLPATHQALFDAFNKRFGL